MDLIFQHKETKIKYKEIVATSVKVLGTPYIRETGVVEVSKSQTYQSTPPWVETNHLMIDLRSLKTGTKTDLSQLRTLGSVTAQARKNLGTPSYRQRFDSNLYEILNSAPIVR